MAGAGLVPGGSAWYGSGATEAGQSLPPGGSSRDFLLGVQWHPEFLLYLRRQRALFNEVVRHAKTRKEHIDGLKY